MGVLRIQFVPIAWHIYKKTSEITNMAPSKIRTTDQITCRLSASLLMKMQRLVDAGEFTNTTDLVNSALHYYINRQELRRDLLHQLMDEMDRKTDEKLRERLYSAENKEFLHDISRDVALEILKDRVPERYS